MKLGRQTWMEIIGEWMVLEGQPTMTWDEVLEMEGGKHPIGVPSTEAVGRWNKRWFESGQTDFGYYSSYEYVYSTIFCNYLVSGSVYHEVGKRETGKLIIDIGGSVFTAQTMLKAGAQHVYVTNFDKTPQVRFGIWAADRLALAITFLEHDSMPPGNPVIVTSEYLEHFQNVDEEVARIARFGNTAWYDKSSFCSTAYGHFNPIVVAGVQHTNVRTANAALKRLMLSHGYKSEVIPLYNRRVTKFTKG